MNLIPADGTFETPWNLEIDYHQLQLIEEPTVTVEQPPQEQEGEEWEYEENKVRMESEPSRKPSEHESEPEREIVD